MSLVRLVEYADASAEVRAVYDDIMATRGTDWISNFRKALANRLLISSDERFKP